MWLVNIWFRFGFLDFFFVTQAHLERWDGSVLLSTIFRLRPLLTVACSQQDRQQNEQKFWPTTKLQYLHFIVDHHQKKRSIASACRSDTIAILSLAGEKTFLLVKRSVKGSGALEECAAFICSFAAHFVPSAAGVIRLNLDQSLNY